MNKSFELFIRFLLFSVSAISKVTAEDVCHIDVFTNWAIFTYLLSSY